MDHNVGRETRHHRIFHGLSRVNESLDRLQDLKFRIIDDGQAPKCKTDNPPTQATPPLAQVLDLAADGLQEYADRLDRLTVEIRDLIF